MLKGEYEFVVMMIQIDTRMNIFLNIKTNA